MKQTITLIIGLMLILLISGCAKVFYTHNCPVVEPLKKVDRVKLYTDSNGQFTARSSYDAKELIDKYEISNEYYRTETIRLKKAVGEMNVTRNQKPIR